MLQSIERQLLAGNGGRSVVGVIALAICALGASLADPAAILSGLSGGLFVLSGHRTGLDGAVDGLSPDGRKLGIADSPHSWRPG